MNKTYILAALAFVFIAMTAIADTTYVCSQVGDWDMFGISQKKQIALVDKNIEMTITIGESPGQEYYEVTANNGSGNLGMCYDGPVIPCELTCTASMVATQRCPCQVCFGNVPPPHDKYIENIIDLLIEAY